MYKEKEELIPNVTQNSKGKWGFVIELGTDPLTNKRKQKTSFKYKSKKFATIAANDWIDEYKVLFSDTRVTSLTKESTLNDAYNEFLKQYEQRTNIKPSSIKFRKASYSMIQNQIGDLCIKNFNLKVFQDFFDSNKERYAPATLSSIKVSLKLILNHLLELNLIEKNYIKDVDIEYKQIYASSEFDDNISSKYLERSELFIFLKIAKKNLSFRYYVMMELLANTGMRIGELSVLQWKDLKGNTLYIYKTFFSENSRTGEYEMLTPKYEASNRQILISDYMVDLLMMWKKEQDLEKKNSSCWDDNNFMFTNESRRGDLCPPSSFKYHFNKLTKDLQENGINQRVTAHVLRHTHVSLLAQAGVPLPNIKNRIGHGDGKVTEKIYLHITKESQIDTLEKFEKLLEL